MATAPTTAIIRIAALAANMTPATATAKDSRFVEDVQVLRRVAVAGGLGEFFHHDGRPTQRRGRGDAETAGQPVSRALHLTTPRHDLQVAIGRGDEDRIDTQVHLTLPPPAGPWRRTTRRSPRRGAGRARPRRVHR